MRSSGTVLRGLSICALVIVGTAAPAVAQLVRMYQLTELPGEDNAQSRAYAVNDTSQVVGWIDTGTTRHSAYWHNETTTDLHGTVHFALKHPIFSLDYGEAFDISNADQIVGTARTLIKCPDQTITVTDGFILRPAVLSDLATPYPGDALVNLSTFGSPCLTAYDSAAIGVSNRNHVVGWADLEGGVAHAFLVSPVNGEFFRDTTPFDGVNDLMVDLGTLAASDPVSSATAVNDAGWVTGYSYTITTGGKAGYHAFLVMPTDNNGDGVGDQWFADNGGGANRLMTDLQTLGGINSWGRDINNGGVVVGESDVDVSASEHYTHAFRWAAGQILDLGTLHNDRSKGFSAASAVNEQGVIVGWAENEKGQRRAFIYENGQMQDLNNLLYLVDENGNAIVPGIVLTEARDINSDGVIVGWGEVRGSQGTKTYGFVLNPTLVDPNSIPAPTQTTGDPNTTTTGTSGYTGDPIFGLPSHLKGSTPDTQTDGNSPATDGTETTPVSQVTALCGGGTLAFLPLTLAGLHLVRINTRRVGPRRSRRRAAS